MEMITNIFGKEVPRYNEEGFELCIECDSYWCECDEYGEEVIKICEVCGGDYALCDC